MLKRPKVLLFGLTFQLHLLRLFLRLRVFGMQPFCGDAGIGSPVSNRELVPVTITALNTELRDRLTAPRIEVGLDDDASADQIAQQAQNVLEGGLSFHAGKDAARQMRWQLHCVLELIGQLSIPLIFSENFTFNGSGAYALN